MWSLYRGRFSIYESLNRPDIYDLSCSNGTPFTNEYLETLNQDPK